MRYRSDLERLATLDATAIESACADPASVRGLIAHAVDEYLDLDLRAEDATAAGDDDLAVYCAQEASAWRATVTTLRMMLTHTTANTTGRVSA